MIHKLTTYLKEGYAYNSIEVCHILNGKQYFFLEIERKKGELLICKKIEEKDSDKLSPHYKRGRPVVLVINTKDVLSKIITLNLNNNPEALIEKAFPNFNFEGFYYELTSFGTHTLVSIIKKEKLSKLLKEFTKHKISIVDFSLGISAIENIKNYLERESIQISNGHLSFNRGTIHKITNAESPDIETVTYIINGLEVDNKYILSFANIFRFVSKQESSVSNSIELKSFYKEEFLNKRFFDIVSKTALGFILGVLLLNFLFFNYYFEKVGELETANEVNGINKKKLTALSNRVVEKERRVDAILASGNSKSSYYLDVIGQSIPNSILINQMLYQPLLKPLRDNKPIDIENKIIMIFGSTINTTEFSNWIKQLEALSWIGKVETEDFDYENNNSSSFSIKIVLNEQ